MRRILRVLAVTAILVLALAVPAFADQGGVPNDDAAFGQGTSFGASNPQAGGVGLNPRDRADLFFNGSVKDTQSTTRDQLRP